MNQSQTQGSAPVAATFDELFDGQGTPRAKAELLVERLKEFGAAELFAHQRAAAAKLRDLGITFYVYGHDAGKEKVWPFDVIPRIFDGGEWATIERGLAQRVEALNHFLADLYGDQKILADGIIPRELVLKQKGYLEACRGIVPRHGSWCNISGTDLVRGGDGQMYVLEDNCRVPSGVSYVLENRAVMKRTFRASATIAGLIERNTGGQRKSGRQATMSSDILYDTLVKYDPDHLLLQITREEAMRGLVDFSRIREMCERVEDRIDLLRLSRVSPLSAPLFLEPGRIPIAGLADERLLQEEVSALLDEAGLSQLQGSVVAS